MSLTGVLKKTDVCFACGYDSCDGIDNPQSKCVKKVLKCMSKANMRFQKPELVKFQYKIPSLGFPAHFF